MRHSCSNRFSRRGCVPKVDDVWFVWRYNVWVSVRYNRVLRSLSYNFYVMIRNFFLPVEVTHSWASSMPNSALILLYLKARMSYVNLSPYPPSFFCFTGKGRSLNRSKFKRARLFVFCTPFSFLKSNKACFLDYHAAYHPFQFLNPFSDIHKTRREHKPNGGNLNAAFFVS